MDKLSGILGAKLHGAYLYGATVFPEGGPVHDIDCHVVLREPPTAGEREAVRKLHGDLAARFPGLGDIDAYIVLLEEARGTSPPRHLLRSDVVDDSWALHCAHVRAGCYVRLCGPEPTEIFPVPSWEGVSAALDGELRYVEEHLCYPAYCVLNLCRIVYSHAERNPAVSKQFSGRWASERFPEWEPLIGAAVRWYRKVASAEDDRLLEEQVGRFLTFSTGLLVGLREGG